MQNIDKTERKLGGEVKYEGRILTMVVDRVETPDGKEAVREHVLHPGGVSIVPLNERGEVLCVRQYRYAHGRVFLEIPAGKLEPGETDRRAAALRELREETGATCETLTHIGDFIPSPAILGEVLSMYLAEGLTMGETDFDDDEFIDIEAIPLDRLCDMIACGEITDGKTQAAILKTKYILEKRKQK
ncbi:MAG: NUDIX domain-containing protein [Eubacteriales bacterium]